jgi:predicted RNA-binding Zn ribbon-like protein
MDNFVPARPVEDGIAADTVSGWLALEFVNTVENYRLEEKLDFISDYSQWIRWGRYEDLISEEEAQSLIAVSERNPKWASKSLADAGDLRTSLYELYSSLANSTVPPEDALDVLNRSLQTSLSHAQVLSGSEGYGRGWLTDGQDLDRMLWPVVKSAADLLTSSHLLRLRQCGGHACSWLFLDLSKNHSRRWCDMKVCGNRAKSQRHHARTRGTQ